MEINITGDNLVVTDAIHDYAVDKVRGLEKFDNGIVDSKVILRVEGERQTAEASVNVPHKTTLFATATTNDMYSAIDGLRDKLAVQIKNHKTKHQQHRG